MRLVVKDNRLLVRDRRLIVTADVSKCPCCGTTGGPCNCGYHGDEPGPCDGIMLAARNYGVKWRVEWSGYAELNGRVVLPNPDPAIYQYQGWFGASVEVDTPPNPTEFQCQSIERFSGYTRAKLESERSPGFNYDNSGNFRNWDNDSGAQAHPPWDVRTLGPFGYLPPPDYSGDFSAFGDIGFLGLGLAEDPVSEWRRTNSGPVPCATGFTNQYETGGGFQIVNAGSWSYSLTDSGDAYEFVADEYLNSRRTGSNTNDVRSEQTVRFHREIRWTRLRECDGDTGSRSSRPQFSEASDLLR